MTYTLWREFQLPTNSTKASEILLFQICTVYHDGFMQLSISHAESMQITKGITVLKDILNEL